jgi:ferredoxin
MGIEVSAVGNMRNASCVNCFKCVAKCPVRGALKIGLAFPRLKDLREAWRKYIFIKGSKP